jgi:hypothetical protein
VEVSAICNRVANVDPDAKADGSVGWLLPIMDWNFLLHLHSTAHRPVDAVEYDQKGIASGLHDLATVFIDRRVY